MRQRKAAFTLVEIMVVVGCLSLLMMMGTLGVRKAIRNARIKQAEGELQIIATAVLQLAWDTGRMPNRALRTNQGSAERWNLSKDVAGLMATDGSYPDWKGPYYEGPVFDPWGQPYFYDPDYTINGAIRPVVGSFGPNRVGRNMYDADDIKVPLDG